MFGNVSRVLVVLAATAAVAQSAPLSTVPGGGPLAGRRLPARRGMMAANPNQGMTSLKERVDDMDSTLNQMHAVLKKMQDKQAKSKVKDSVATANLEMWSLMVTHMDKELQELRVALAMREDMESRRAAMYKQADAKAEAEAQAARAAQAAKFTGTAPTPGPGVQGAQSSPAALTAPAQPSAPPASNSPSPK